LTRFLAVPFILGPMFFLPAGTLRYWQAWAYLTILCVLMLVATVLLLKKDPGLLERRLQMKEKREGAEKNHQDLLPHLPGHLPFFRF